MKVWLWLLFKLFFIQKCIKIIFFLFFKNYFYISILKWSKNTKKYINLKQKKNFNFFKNIFKIQKQTWLKIKVNRELRGIYPSFLFRKWEFICFSGWWSLEDVIGDYLCVRFMSLVIEIDLLFGLFFSLMGFFWEGICYREMKWR